MMALFRCFNEACDRFHTDVKIDVLIGDEGFEIYGDDTCPACHERLQPVHTPAEIERMNREEWR